MPDPQTDIRRNAANSRAASIELVQQVAERIAHSVGQVIVGKRNEVRLTVLGLLCQGHILIEDVPGVGKTTMARALARSIGCTFSRIQFTPEMQPNDVTGVSIFNPQVNKFEFHPGPIMAQIVLADEINRAHTRVHAALLEAMEERQVTVDGVSYPLPDPFLLLATQNPIEYEGTFPLPEAQIDRFMLRIHLGYPAPLEEKAVLTAQQYEHPIQNVYQVVTAQDLIAAQRAVRDIYAAEEIKDYIVALVNATRTHPDVYLGCSPRGSLALFRCAQARAAMAGRDYVIPDDVKALAEVTLAHRIIVGASARVKDISSRVIVQEVLATTPIPGATARQ
jgi:MoxR-like ATPase